MGAIFLAGHRGMVGQAIHRRLQAEGAEVLTADRSALDLRDGAAVGALLAKHRPSQVILAAAKVGGIHANNTYPADFLFDNLAIQNSVIQGAFAAGVQQLLFLGSSCIYPRDAAQPMKEDALLTGPLEPTNEPYALAKIAGIKLCESYNRQHGTDYRAVMPTNLYGPFDNFHPENSHVLPALLRRFHEAKLAKAPEVVVWGSGTPMREFLHVDDMAEASLHVLRLDRAAYEAHTQPMQRHVNVGTGVDVTIRELAEQVAAVVGYEGQLTFDASKPDGTPRKLLDVSLLAQLGWRAHIGLREGLAETYAWFCEQSGTLRLG
jgi:nucleoside-diphosphate-sugar epimerase